jgi:hypothetical protein
MHSVVKGLYYHQQVPMTQDYPIEASYYFGNQYERDR